MTCEDFPCCGHTDGLGCDWVSPNEIVPCDVCIEARRPMPYHDGHSCPTVRANAIAEASLNVPADFECEECGEADSKHPEFMFLCYNCGEEANAFWTQMAHEQGYFDN